MPGTGIYAGRGGSYTDNGGGNYTLDAETIYAGAVIPASTRPMKYERITLSTTTPAQLNPPIGANRALIQARKLAMWRDDGGALSASAGVLLRPVDYLNYKGPLSSIRFLAVDAGAEIDVSYYAGE